MKRKLITYKDRKIIEKLVYMNVDISFIASFLEFTRQTIYRELNRCQKGNYKAEDAQKTVIQGKERSSNQ